MPALDPNIWGPKYWFFLHTIAMTYPHKPNAVTRESFIRWMHFIHNKINVKLEKPTITLDEFYVLYYEAYKSKDTRSKEYYKWREKIIYILIVFGITGLIAYLYNK